MVLYDDPRILRAIAHPTRNRVLHELSAAGSLRAADIARRIDVPANQASFHLRQLAKYGLVEEDPEAARDRRDRVWRLVDPQGIRFRTSDMLAQPGGQAAYAVFQRNAVEWGRHLVERAFTPPDDGARPERSISEWALLLTPGEAEELMNEIADLVDRRRLAAQRPGSGGADDERETYSVYQLIQPYPGLPVDQPTEENDS
ncbi:helix-turn-helix domain-containing protein [Pimelobacter simplex]|uniref:Transcriptional regulator, ArsR family n=1 Tax=Nocardioides simplex TaxID=2045 RepID=A0A0C5XHV0_NOCSI|nr:helix-turn-helix domain-containing protein [Pimelobacter simplex]AJR18726.1 Transcriptional regulator, ArsR family [Pimelobacter simplex]MCG8148929.1 helix-turn-helix domain-containing protein [Pimelobacter simplex]GEB14743.1 transcriptional regulator [Pimelobacter simplex]SFM25950.1 Helix-turn-helix domain-containing protein [Pimelobacter simplex]